MAKPSQPKTSSPESQEGEETQNTSAPHKAAEQSATPNDNAANSKAEEEGKQQDKNREGKGEDKKGGEGFDDFMGDEASLHFPSSSSPPSPPSSPPASPEESPEQGEGWRKQAEQWEDKARRAMAEEANTRNRLERERAELLKFAAAPLANEILPVADILNNAIKSLPDTWQDNKELKNFIDGLHMTEQNLQAALQKCHIRQIGKVGDKFDATYHQALSVIDDKTAEPNTIIEVLQPGYMLHDRILRPAQVIISKPSPSAP